MILSRQKAAVVTREAKEAKERKKPQLDDFINNRDYSGAIALLEFNRNAGLADESTLPWLGYCAFHLGDYKKAMEIYTEIVKARDADPMYFTYLACCQFCLGMYKEAEDNALKGPQSRLQTRILFHVAHKFNDESKLMIYHQKLTESVEDQLSLASIHYLRSHFQEATDIYKRLLLENREYQALNVYVALCYYKLDYYDVSLEILAVYLQGHPDSTIAINLKACNHFRLYNGKAAEAELKVLADMATSVHSGMENDLIRHNLVVFRGGENALQVLPPLIDVIPEARLNLVIYYLRSDEMGEAYNLIKDLEPTTPQEYILKGVVNSAVGQATDSREHIKMAQQYFQLVGASASECDTIPGRQCMASCFFLLKHYIMNKKPRLAWELYLKMETSNESFSLLQLIANDCFKMGSFFYAAKAFDVLERLDPNPEYWEGKRGACVGVFQQIIAGKEPKDSLRDVLAMLRNTSNPQVEYFIRIMKKWAKDNNLKMQ
eukprot:tig00000042_g15583.t1